MRGLVFDINVQGLAAYLVQMVVAQGLGEFWSEANVPVLSVADLGYRRDASDRIIWTRCQAERFVLVTDNRNDDGPDSLQATLSDSLRPGSLPVLTIANRGRFQHDRGYALVVAAEFMETVLDVQAGRSLGTGRVFLPTRPVA